MWYNEYSVRVFCDDTVIALMQVIITVMVEWINTDLEQNDVSKKNDNFSPHSTT
jgi:hypothetical protein